MITTLLHLLRLFPFLCGDHRQLALENLALRHQLAVYKRTVPRPRLRRTDRLLWVWLARIWTGWRAALVIVALDTVLRWQRRRFRAHWTKLSRRPTGGRPPVNPGIKALVTRMGAANPLWRATLVWTLLAPLWPLVRPSAVVGLGGCGFGEGQVLRRGRVVGADRW
jgi:hypothetical protein